MPEIVGEEQRLLEIVLRKLDGGTARKPRLHYMVGFKLKLTILEPAHHGNVVPVARASELSRAVDRVRALAPRVEPVADRLLVYTDDGDRTAAEITSDGIGASSVLVRRASLEDVFLILTGRSLED